MPRCRFVQPDVVRLFLADTAKQALTTLREYKDPKPTPEELADAAERVRQAEVDADFIVVKKQLNAGEQRMVFAGLVKNQTMHFGEKPDLDAHLVGKTKVIQYLVSWSFCDADGRPVDVSPEAIDSLDADTYRDLVEAVDQHEAAMDEAKKNGRMIGLTEPVLT